MRTSFIGSLLLLAVSPLSALALPVDPNDVAGQWDPSGQYRKGQWQHGVFVANNGENQNDQWHNNNNNNNNNQNGQYNPDQNGWTDANGQWHTNNQNVQTGQSGQNGQSGWTDEKGQWHANNQINQNNQNGWTDEKGQWHANNQDNQNNQNGWTDANGQWHANQKRQAIPAQANPATAQNDRLNEAGNNKANNAQVTPSSANDRYQSYGNYKNYGSYQNYPVNGQNQAQNKDTKAITGQQE
ncbi:uncharacterized protein N7500_008558 [Penicillium coprophilum]|uniref:uncharacterized protein n=1 Tax=Penicillium coprophilum TaxID=36646 RepID=UPI0023881335|nr:uncharacterized protein N7500_008558 [Penicillium coprophilum]KAJ5158907.1 hypothetical protein N7500_008558 [Penicillium coprophilum]